MRTIALVLMFFAPLLATAQTKTTTKHTPEAVAAVSQCYTACFNRYLDGVEWRYNQTNKVGNGNWAYCRIMRAEIYRMEYCDSGCNEIWSAYGKPPSKLRDPFQASLKAEKALYASGSSCQSHHAKNDHLDTHPRILQP